MLGVDVVRLMAESQPVHEDGISTAHASVLRALDLVEEQDLSVATT